MSISRIASVGLCLALAQAAQAQQPPAPERARDTVSALVLTAGEADGERRRRQLINALALDFGFTTFNLGGGLLFDVAAYAQDSTAFEQIQPTNMYKLRDARILINGRLATRRPITWQTGIMYDQTNEKWLFRQTGLMVAVPEISSNFFVGRAKEGFSLNKVMVGYDGWSMERMPFTDATIPLLADGIKWLGSIKDNHYFWNLGLFTDWLSEGQTFSHYDHQFVLRAGWVPLISDSVGTLLHIGLNFRTGKPNADSLHLKSKPESFTAPNFIDTGKFASSSAQTFGPEIYFRPSNLLVGGEYYWQRASTADFGDVWFHGGEFVIAWLTTGETRSYNTVGHYFRSVSPNATVIQKGPGAWETVVKITYADLVNGGVDGGIFWRITPMINWHLTDNLRLEMAYGYSVLNRFGMKGDTQFFQSRLQMQL
ncbi:MAG TPA: porin [Longimicrobiales bacterium]